MQILNKIFYCATFSLTFIVLAIVLCEVVVIGYLISEILF
jgi:hypothetical protein